MPNEGDREGKCSSMGIGIIVTLAVVGIVVYLFWGAIDFSPREVFRFKFMEYQDKGKLSVKTEEIETKVIITQKYITFEGGRSFILSIVKTLNENENVIRYGCENDIQHRYSVVLDKKNEELTIYSTYDYMMLYNSEIKNR